MNWCDPCQTVLANEQVEAGLCWRCGKPVRQKKLRQWFFRITRYAEDLLLYCDRLPGWPEKVITMQKNWIGKSLGAEIRFPLESGSGEIIRLHHAPRHRLRGHLHVPRARAPARAATLQGHPAGGGRHRVHRAHLAPGPLGQGDRDLREGGRLHRRLLPQPDDRPAHADLHRQLRADGVRHRRGHGGAGARPARLRVRAQVRPAGRGGGPAAGRRAGPRDDGRGVSPGDGAHGELRRLRRDAQPARRWRRSPPGSRTENRRAAHGQLPVARLGHLAPALLGRAHPDHLLRALRRRPGARAGPAGRAAGGRGSRSRAASRRCRRSSASSTSPARTAASRPGARPTPWTPSSSPPGTSSASAARTAPRACSTARRWTTGCRSTSTSAASSTRSCTCCTRASTRACCGTRGWCPTRNRSRAC